MESPDSNGGSNGASDDTPEQSSVTQGNADAEADANNPPDGTNAAEPRKTRRRGRQAKDPLGQSLFFKVQRAEDLETKLREYLADPTGDPEHTTLEFSFPVTAAFMVSAREPKGPSAHDKRIPYVYSAFNKTAVSVIDALHTIKDPKDQMLMQKAISKTLVETVQQADGYRYSFHNHWISREDQASRFSYFCNDSVLNKGRAANEGAAKVRMGVKIRKPVYECQGLISIKFSVSKMSLELYYKHVPLHQTYEERAPPPRKDSKRRKLLEIFHPEKLPKPKEKKRKPEAPPHPASSLRRKRRATEPLPETETEPRPQNARESSLQPLFDFLGSAGRLEEEQPTPTLPEQTETEGSAAGPNPANVPHSTSEEITSHTPDGTSLEASTQRKSKNIYPGMMSGYMSGDHLTWGRRKVIKVHRGSRRRVTASVPEHTTEVTTTPTPAPAETAPLIQSVFSPPTEVDLLMARLQEAERKIRDLEAEKNRAAAPITWTAQQHPRPPPPPPHVGVSHPFYPPPHFQYPQPQWQYSPHPPTLRQPPGPEPSRRSQGPGWPPPQSAPPRPDLAPVAPPPMTPAPSLTAVQIPEPTPTPAVLPSAVSTPAPTPNQSSQDGAPLYGFVPSPEKIAPSSPVPPPGPYRAP
ncbi:hypothetical protein A1O3_05975 [Capronia epimyces CBS 606.96]|uniref:Uncharacterized protein n=1 Tax=Capronia epimyces CBS 606.96 TaxID=1182542 RepID=W9Y6P1_9EURO|nr:uncharacterized protein A1O3_05975 [Capronia epimyces CBS 606.96]EXJ85300.1 hypothetical protein A1O3_05975 [Capronia epimyces CBS 606.96]